MLRKIFLIPWFGKYPEWIHKWVGNIEYLKSMGYEYKIYSNLKLFKERVHDILGIDCNIVEGTGKAWDFRPALGKLFPEDVKGYDYWGHTDFDCVYGDVAKFIPDKELKKYDIWTNENRYICGPWTLYKNCPEVNNAFNLSNKWIDYMSGSEANGWVEDEFTRIVNQSFKIKYELNQPYNWDDFSKLRFINGSLYEGDREIMMAHFRRVKQWPIHSE